MSETPETPSPSVPVADLRGPLERPGVQRDRSRLITALIAVGIATGIVIVAAILFFWGFFVGRHSYWGDDDGGPMGRGGNYPMMQHGMMGPGMMGPGGMGPGGMGPGGMGPGGMSPGGMGPGGMGPGAPCPNGTGMCPNGIAPSPATTPPTRP